MRLIVIAAFIVTIALEGKMPAWFIVVSLVIIVLSWVFGSDDDGSSTIG